MEKYYCKYSIHADIANQMIIAGVNKAKQLGLDMVIAVLDESAVLKAFYRMDGAALISVQLAQNKAYTAITHPWGLSTHEIFEFIKEKPAALASIPQIPKYVMFDGGYPIKIDGHIIGALGVSGGRVEEDEQVARAALSIL